jgi:hypothetical protein
MFGKRQRLTWFAFILAVASVTPGCGGGGDSPTSPSGGYTLLVFGTWQNSSYRATMLGVKIKLDGRTIRDYSSNTAFSDIAMSQDARVNQGQHTVEFVVANQTSSPNSYRISGSVDVFDERGTHVRTVNLPEKTATLSNGQGVSYTFSF